MKLFFDPTLYISWPQISLEPNKIMKQVLDLIYSYLMVLLNFENYFSNTNWTKISHFAMVCTDKFIGLEFQTLEFIEKLLNLSVCSWRMKTTFHLEIKEFNLIIDFSPCFVCLFELTTSWRMESVYPIIWDLSHVRGWCRW